MSEVLKQEEKIAKSLFQFSPREMAELELAANVAVAGGAPLKGPVRDKAILLEVAYRSTGRLRPIAYAMLRPEPKIGHR